MPFRSKKSSNKPFGSARRAGGISSDLLGPFSVDHLPLNGTLRRTSSKKFNKRANAKATFVLIPSIIGIEDEIRRRLDASMTIDLMQNKVFRPIIEEAMEKAAREAMASTLCTLLEKRFGKVAPRARKQIQNADRATLDRWIVRVGDSPSLKEVFQ